MNLATRIRYGLARWLLKAGGLAVVPEWLDASFIMPSFRALTEEGYRKNSAVLACIAVHAFAFPEAPFRVYAADGDDAPALPTHPLRQLLLRPNPRMGEDQLKLHTIVYAAIGGNAYWHKVRDRGGRPRELWPYHAGQISPVPGGPGWIKHYTFDNGTGELQVIPVEDIVHFQWPTPDPSQPWQAMPPLSAAAREIDTDSEITRYLFALLKNDAIPRTALVLPPNSNAKESEIKRMREQFQERYSGANRGGAMILEQGADIKRVGLDLAELAFDALHRIPETRIAADLRVPPILAGLAAGIERSTMANYAESRQAYTQTTLAPLWGLFGSTMTAQLLQPDYAGAGEVRADLSRVQALQEDATAKWKRSREAYVSQVITKNEARRYIGFGDVAGGDTFYEPVRAQTPALSAAKLIDVTSVRKSLPTPSARRSTDAIEARITKAVSSYLAGEYTAAAAAIRDQAKREPVLLDPSIVEQLGLDLGPAIRRTLSRFYPDLLQRAFDDAGLALDQDIAFDLENRRVQDVLDELATLVTRVSDTTRQEIRDLVGRQAAEGWDLTQLADAIEALAEGHSESRAARIARTETASAYSRGSLLAYADSGVVTQVEWLTALDDLTSPACRALSGQRVALGAVFSDGTPHPPQHPNCRCTLLPIVGED